MPNRGDLLLLVLVLPASISLAAPITLSCTVQYGDRVSDRVLYVDEAVATVNGKPAAFEAGRIDWTETLPDAIASISWLRVLAARAEQR